MQGYESKEALIAEIRKTAALFVTEFDDVAEAEANAMAEGVDRTPREMLAYQLGWMELLRGWDADELAGKDVVTPAPGFKWNQMGALYQGFYDRYSTESMDGLIRAFEDGVDSLVRWVDGFSDEELFEPGGRKWAQSTPSNWPVWKWIYMNTVAPYKSFRGKIRKWKKTRA
ncbi:MULTISPECIES: ClbS/DfsB family four-helix bundle protein [Gordonibacter]|uniref:ClbS/DfsB family four-helix bundle protein n=1 Tax=Gordonibacter faecis TaxID=3047475 RepID=A0ABT7DQI2_9ACTN|nr:MULTISPECIES: ClbS/DfsB family four-helix bundle protein [unclassified Gordonibacter]MDJ1651667.1 ClbS/DfsB family four-helix bundle protein [Gordonibacter sp. KGMB12511]HIW77091.1 ClbS/DfsB family four-helix bundle protein [Candidatus Gordonibacter avicola]